MTEQIKSAFLYKSQPYSAFISSQNQLFDLSVFQLQPSTTNSANWDGYLATYALREQTLVVLSLYVLLLGKKNSASLHIEGPTLRRVKPVFEKKGFFNNYYENLNHPLDYSGKILLAKEQKKSRYVPHFSFLWDYEDATELVFQDGQLLQERDRSETMQRLQKTLMEETKQQNLPELFSWCELFFEYPYDMQV